MQLSNAAECAFTEFKLNCFPLLTEQAFESIEQCLPDVLSEELFGRLERGEYKGFQRHKSSLHLDAEVERLVPERMSEPARLSKVAWDLALIKLRSEKEFHGDIGNLARAARLVFERLGCMHGSVILEFAQALELVDMSKSSGVNLKSWVTKRQVVESPRMRQEIQENADEVGSGCSTCFETQIKDELRDFTRTRGDAPKTRIYQASTLEALILGLELFGDMNGKWARDCLNFSSSVGMNDLFDWDELYTLHSKFGGTHFFADGNNYDNKLPSVLFAYVAWIRFNCLKRSLQTPDNFAKVFNYYRYLLYDPLIIGHGFDLPLGGNKSGSATTITDNIICNMLMWTYAYLDLYPEGSNEEYARMFLEHFCGDDVLRSENASVEVCVTPALRDVILRVFGLNFEFEDTHDLMVGTFMGRTTMYCSSIERFVHKCDASKLLSSLCYRRGSEDNVYKQKFHSIALLLWPQIDAYERVCDIYREKFHESPTWNHLMISELYCHAEVAREQVCQSFDGGARKSYAPLNDWMDVPLSEVIPSAKEVKAEIHAFGRQLMDPISAAQEQAEVVRPPTTFGFNSAVVSTKMALSLVPTDTVTATGQQNVASTQGEVWAMIFPYAINPVLTSNGSYVKGTVESGTMVLNLAGVFKSINTLGQNIMHNSEPLLSEDVYGVHIWPRQFNATGVLANWFPISIPPPTLSAPMSARARKAFRGKDGKAFIYSGGKFSPLPETTVAAATFEFNFGQILSDQQLFALGYVLYLVVYDLSGTGFAYAINPINTPTPFQGTTASVTVDTSDGSLVGWTLFFVGPTGLNQLGDMAMAWHVSVFTPTDNTAYPVLPNVAHVMIASQFDIFDNWKVQDLAFAGMGGLFTCTASDLQNGGDIATYRMPPASGPCDINASGNNGFQSITTVPWSYTGKFRDGAYSWLLPTLDAMKLHPPNQNKYRDGAMYVALVDTRPSGILFTVQACFAGISNLSVYSYDAPCNIPNFQALLDVLRHAPASTSNKEHKGKFANAVKSMVNTLTSPAVLEYAGLALDKAGKVIPGASVAGTAAHAGARASAAIRGQPSPKKTKGPKPPIPPKPQGPRLEGRRKPSATK